MVKFVRRDLHCWTDISSYANQQSIDVIKVIGEMIIGSGTGWEFDPRTPENEYIYIKSQNNNYQYPVSYLVNSISGAKLMLFVFGHNASEDNISNSAWPNISNRNYLRSPFLAQYTTEGSRPGALCGVMMSMIPAGSGSEFPSEITQDLTTKFIPNDAIPIVQNAIKYDATYMFYKGYSSLSAVTTGNILSYGLLVDSEVIMLFSGHSTTSVRPTLYLQYALGKIVGTLAHGDLDNTIYSHYGVIRSDNFCGEGISFSKELNGVNVSFNGYPLTSTSSNGIFNRPVAGFYDVNGNFISMYSTYCAVSYDLLTSAISNSVESGVTRWCPIALANMYAPGTQGRYIVPGDGFKGYLDTNLFRSAICTKGSFYNNGQFLGIEFNMLVAWDPDATDTIM